MTECKAIPIHQLVLQKQTHHTNCTPHIKMDAVNFNIRLRKPLPNYNPK